MPSSKNSARSRWLAPRRPTPSPCTMTHLEPLRQVRRRPFTVEIHYRPLIFLTNGGTDGSGQFGYDQNAGMAVSMKICNPAISNGAGKARMIHKAVLEAHLVRVTAQLLLKMQSGVRRTLRAVFTCNRRAEKGHDPVSSHSHGRTSHLRDSRFRRPGSARFVRQVDSSSSSAFASFKSA